MRKRQMLVTMFHILRWRLVMFAVLTRTQKYNLHSFHVLDEAEKSLHDALCVLSQTVNDSRVLFGGGWPEMVMQRQGRLPVKSLMLLMLTRGHILQSPRLLLTMLDWIVLS